MALTVRRILEHIISAKELVSFLIGPLTAGWAYWKGMMEGYPAIVQFIAILAVFAFTSFGVASLLVIADQWLVRSGTRREMNTAADHLQNMLDTNQDCLPIGFIAEVWAGDNVEKDYIYNPRLRRIKRAVKEGKIEKCESTDKIAQEVMTASFSRMMTRQRFESSPVNIRTPVNVV